MLTRHFSSYFITGLALLASGASLYADPVKSLSDWKALQAIMDENCYGCHNDRKSKGGLNLERFANDPNVAGEHKLWEKVAHVVDKGEMPPDELMYEPDKKQLMTWLKTELDHVALANAGDPGLFTVRRLTNVEYDNTVRELTGRSYKFSKDFLPDGGGGEGFSNVGDVLFVSPQQLDKYFMAARLLADYATILPGSGIQFQETKVGLRSPEQMRDQAEQGLYIWYQKMAEPHLPKDFEDLLEDQYMLACWKFKHKDKTGAQSLEQLARDSKLHPIFLQNWWNMVNSEIPASKYLDLTRVAWRELPGPSDDPAKAKEVPEAVKQQIATIKAQRRSWWSFDKPGTGVQRMQQDSDGLRPNTYAIGVYGKKQGTIVVSDITDGNQGDYLLVSNITIETGKKRENYLPWLRRRLDEDKKALQALTNPPAPTPPPAPAKPTPAPQQQPKPVQQPVAANNNNQAPKPQVPASQPAQPSAPKPSTAPSAPVTTANNGGKPAANPPEPAAQQSKPAQQPVAANNNPAPKPQAPNPQPAAQNPAPAAKPAGNSQPTQVAAANQTPTPAPAPKAEQAPQQPKPTQQPAVANNSPAPKPQTPAPKPTSTPTASVTAANNVNKPATNTPTPKPEQAPQQPKPAQQPTVANSKPAAAPNPAPQPQKPAVANNNNNSNKPAPAPAPKPNSAPAPKLDAETLKKRIAEAEAILAKYGKHPQGTEVSKETLVLHAPALFSFPIPDGATRIFATGQMDLHGKDSDFTTLQWMVTADKPLDPTKILPGVTTIWKRQTPAHNRTMADFNVMKNAFPDEYLRRLEEVARNYFRGPSNPPGKGFYPGVYYFSNDQLNSILPQQEKDRFVRMQKDWRLLKSKNPNQKDQQEWDDSLIGHLQYFAAKAWRRPLTQEDKDELKNLYVDARARELDRESSAREVLVRIFISPDFIFKLEDATQPGEHPINSWELASRLSYFLWSAPPDSTLRQAAADGSIMKPEVLVRETKRMLKDRRAQSLAKEFAGQWLEFHGFDNFGGVDTGKFPEFTPELRRDMNRETEEFFSYLIKEDRPVNEILLADYTFLNERLAKHYGIPNITGEGFQKVNVVSHHRGGLLGMGSILAKTSYPQRTSPVLRGNWLLAAVLGTPTPPPPPDAPALQDDAAAKATTLRAKLEAHRADKACSSCHDKIDPLGFALEAYDPIGRFRTKDEGGLPIDNKASLKDGTPLDGIEGLRKYLATRDTEFETLFSRKLIGYALGRTVLPTDKVLIDTMISELKKADGRISSAVLTLVQSRQFKNRRNE